MARSPCASEEAASRYSCQPVLRITDATYLPRRAVRCALAFNMSARAPGPCPTSMRARSVPAHRGPNGALTSDAWWPLSKDACLTWPRFSEPNRGLSSAAGSSMESSRRRASSSQKLPAHPRSGPGQQQPSTGAACALRPHRPLRLVDSVPRPCALRISNSFGFDAARACGCKRTPLCARGTALAIVSVIACAQPVPGLVHIRRHSGQEAT